MVLILIFAEALALYGLIGEPPYCLHELNSSMKQKLLTMCLALQSVSFWHPRLVQQPQRNHGAMIEWAAVR